MAWLEMEQERPSRSDWYAMQTAAEIRRSGLKDPNAVKLNDMKLKLHHPEPPKVITKEEASAQARSRWFGFLGVKRQVTDG
jgi:hypothetical protein